MAITLGFDVYGTLIDTAGIASALQVFAGEKTAAFTGLWRDKQLEYSFRRGLMQNYQHFAVCTRNALDYCCAALAIDIADRDREALMARYRMLPAFARCRSCPAPPAGGRLSSLCLFQRQGGGCCRSACPCRD
jgi:2-haloacid dehalogenase